MSQYKTLEQADIEAAFEDILEKNGQVTSLEIKKKLRKQGFWSTQAKVGIALRDIADAKGCDWDFNGTFRTYYKPSTQTSPASVTIQTVKTVTPRVPIPDVLRDAILAPEKDDWEVYAAPGSITVYFSGKLRSGQAKSLYVQQMGADFLDVRVVRVR